MQVKGKTTSVNGRNRLIVMSLFCKNKLCFSCLTLCPTFSPDPKDLIACHYLLSHKTFLHDCHINSTATMSIAKKNPQFPIKWKTKQKALYILFPLSNKMFTKKKHTYLPLVIYENCIHF